jgi:death-on-curing protein
MPTKYVSQFDLLQLRAKLAAQEGEHFDVLNLDNLKSALAAPRQSMFGEELHATLWEKAAALVFSLIKNHPFYDGNKRIALLAVGEFLRRNGWELTAAPEEALRFSTRIAASDVTNKEIAQWLREHSKKVEMFKG